MKTSLLSSFLFIGLLFGFTPTVAYVAQEGNVTALVGPIGYLTDAFGFGDEFQPAPRGGLGLVALGDINEKGSLEIAIFHLNKSFFRKDQDLLLAENTQNIHITMGYRRWWTPRFSGSLAVFSAYTMGESTVLAQSPSLPEDFKTSARDVVNYGLDFSIQSELWESGPYAAVLDTRYSLALTPKAGERSSHFSALFGIRYLIQDRVEPPPQRRSRD